MQGAKSMQKYNETALHGLDVTIQMADFHRVTTDRVKKVLPYLFMLPLTPTTPRADETGINPC